MGGKGASSDFPISGPNNLKERFVLEQIAAPNLPRGWSGTTKYLYLKKESQGWLQALIQLARSWPILDKLYFLDFLKAAY